MAIPWESKYSNVGTLGHKVGTFKLKIFFLLVLHRIVYIRA
jgi:hypothetical protein